MSFYHPVSRLIHITALHDDYFHNVFKKYPYTIIPGIIHNSSIIMARTKLYGPDSSLKLDESEDNLILCFTEGQPCANGKDALGQLQQQGGQVRKN